MKRLLAFAAVVGALFALVTVLKTGPSESSGAAEALPVSAAERDRVRRFWETYREATELRIAGRTREAAEAYGRALALDPEHHDALYYLGNMEFDLGDFAAAERAWRHLIAVEPTMARAHSQLGALYFCVGEGVPLQPDRAVAELRSAAAINREETGPLLGLGEIALVRGDAAEAREYLDAVIGSNFTSVEAHFYKGYLAWKSGAVEEAAELLAAAGRHAEPPAPPPGASAEGDTRSGAAPMVRPPVRCGALRARVDELAVLDTTRSVARQVGPVFGAFDALLQEVRRHLPS